MISIFINLHQNFLTSSSIFCYCCCCCFNYRYRNILSLALMYDRTLLDIVTFWTFLFNTNCLKSFPLVFIPSTRRNKNTEAYPQTKRKKVSNTISWTQKHLVWSFGQPACQTRGWYILHLFSISWYICFPFASCGVWINI